MFVTAPYASQQQRLEDLGSCRLRSSAKGKGLAMPARLRTRRGINTRTSEVQLNGSKPLSGITRLPLPSLTGTAWLDNC